jgi:PKHD-type hydroxylase
MLTLGEVLPREDVIRVREALAALPFADGRATAGATARTVKSNTQADRTDGRVQALAAFVRAALERHELLGAYARPARWSDLMFSRYASGDSYGLHVDAATMAAEGGGRLRTDLSFTLFLSDPEDYEGGALLIDGLDGERELRPAAGSLVIYDTGALHRVTPVTRGERLACVGWLQSQVRRVDQRQLLFDLARVQASLPAGETRLLLSKSIGNLLRMWAEL